MPVVEIMRPIPAIAWVPMSIMLWPNNEASIVFITFIGAFFPILLNTIHGVHSLDGVLIRAARCLGASELRLLVNVILPGSLPHIFTGLAVGMGVAWVSLIAAEMISGQFGVGYFTWEAYSLVDYPAIVLGMITIGFLGLACSGIIRMVGVLLMPWLAFAPEASDDDGNGRSRNPQRLHRRSQHGRDVRRQRQQGRRRRERVAQRAARRVRLADRTLRLRQVDLAQHRRRLRQADARRGHARRQGDYKTRLGPRRRVPAILAVSLAVGSQERRVRPEDGRRRAKQAQHHGARRCSISPGCSRSRTTIRTSSPAA